MAVSCPNCGTCTCTGTHLVKANNGTQVCSKCVNIYNNSHQVQNNVQTTNTTKTKQ